MSMQILFITFLHWTIDQLVSYDEKHSVSPGMYMFLYNSL